MGKSRRHEKATFLDGRWPSFSRSFVQSGMAANSRRGRPGDVGPQRDTSARRSGATLLRSLVAVEFRALFPEPQRGAPRRGVKNPAQGENPGSGATSYGSRPEGAAVFSSLSPSERSLEAPRLFRSATDRSLPTPTMDLSAKARFWRPPTPYFSFLGAPWRSPNPSRRTTDGRPWSTRPHRSAAGQFLPPPTIARSAPDRSSRPRKIRRSPTVRSFRPPTTKGGVRVARLRWQIQLADLEVALQSPPPKHVSRTGGSW